MIEDDLRKGEGRGSQRIQMSLSSHFDACYAHRFGYDDILERSVPFVDGPRRDSRGIND